MNSKLKGKSEKLKKGYLKWPWFSSASPAMSWRVLRGVGNCGTGPPGKRDNLYPFFALSKPRISLIIIPCSRRMDRRMVSIGQGQEM